MTRRGGTGLEPIAAAKSLAEDAADRIRERILAGGYQQGEHLVEANIAAQLSTSRGPVREAFKLLRAEGLLEEEPRRGTFVVRRDTDDVREIYELRAALEGAAARSLARSGEAAAVSELRNMAEAIAAAADSGDAKATAQADLAFHERVCELSGNSRIHEVFTRYIPTLRALLRLDEQVIRSLTDIAEQHRPLVEAIATEDAQLAGRLFAEHAEQAGEQIALYLGERSV